jgi:cytoskeletal protein CcmA (bactofilin family)
MRSDFIRVIRGCLSPFGFFAFHAALPAFRRKHGMRCAAAALACARLTFLWERNLTVDGTVARNARVAGGRVEIGPRAQVNGNVSIAGGELTVAGAVQGYVQAAAGDVYINGTVGGDVVAAGGTIELGPNARIAGALRYASGEEIRRDPAAQVAGGITRMTVEHRRERTARRGISWVWSVGLIVLAAVLAAAAPALTSGAALTLRTRPGMSILIGLAALVGIPIAIVVLLATVIGIPLALLALVLYFALLLAGYAITAIGLGDWLLARWRAADAQRALWRAGAAALAMLAIALLTRVPFVGGLIVFVVLLFGLGALVMQARPTQSPGAGT